MRQGSRPSDTARLRVPPTAEKHPYDMTSYADLYTVTVDGSDERAGKIAG